MTRMLFCVYFMREGKNCFMQTIALSWMGSDHYQCVAVSVFTLDVTVKFRINHHRWARLSIFAVIVCQNLSAKLYYHGHQLCMHAIRIRDRWLIAHSKWLTILWMAITMCNHSDPRVLLTSLENQFCTQFAQENNKKLFWCSKFSVAFVQTPHRLGRDETFQRN